MRLLLLSLLLSTLVTAFKHDLLPVGRSEEHLRRFLAAINDQSKPLIYAQKNGSQPLIDYTADFYVMNISVGTPRESSCCRGWLKWGGF